MEWYPWLNEIYIQILSSYKINKKHHLLLIQSRRDNGVDSLIYALNRWLMCHHPIGNKSCNKCQSCYLMQSYSHPDYYVLKPESNTQNIGVEKVRILVENLYRYSYVANLKIVYIKNSEWLTEGAVNSLLKIFEEPPNGVYFFLGCRDFTHLLPTFLSRCLKWVLAIPSEQVSLEWLYRKKGIENNKYTLSALRLCGGSPLEAYCILKSNYWELRLKLCVELGKAVVSNDFFNMLFFIQNSEYESKTLVFWLCSLLIDAMKWSQGIHDFLVNIDQVDLICQICMKFSLLRLNRQLQQWLIILSYWENNININKKLLLAYQLLNIEGHVLNVIY